jgi:hypothetical protein
MNSEKVSLRGGIGRRVSGAGYQVLGARGDWWLLSEGCVKGKEAFDQAACLWVISS